MDEGIRRFKLPLRLLDESYLTVTKRLAFKPLFYFMSMKNGKLRSIGSGLVVFAIGLSTLAQNTQPIYPEANIPMSAETHGGEDVAIFAIGPNAHLIRGSMEQNWIFYVMADALRLARK